ncbi:Protein of unknown function [Pyronema omphalodes CBS 100304]|uniref:Uncharacterized protein n=1 Tax=Pyronema omphalodes (strain CBS 100304) TaxID=1076935 RepID=U4L117_PYROM|nr:Protein of unknown function [Pyronema omphalodes CBS 100304]
MVINFPADCNNTGMYHAYGYQNPQAQQVQYAQNQYAQQQYAQQQQQQYSQQLQQQYAQQQQQQQQQQQYTQQQYAQQQYAQQQQAQQQYAQHQYAQHQYAQHQYAPQIQCQPETYAASEGLRFAPLQPATQPQVNPAYAAQYGSNVTHPNAAAYNNVYNADGGYGYQPGYSQYQYRGY